MFETLPWRGILGVRGAFAALACGAAFVQPIRPMVFVGESMSPTYHTGEIAFTLPVTGELHPGDVVVVERPDGPIVKRVAYVPGDRIMQVRISGEWTDSFGGPPRKAHVKNVRYVAVPEGMVYVLGDNRGQSFDSREFGPVPISSIQRILVHPKPRTDYPLPPSLASRPTART